MGKEKLSRIIGLILGIVIMSGCGGGVDPVRKAYLDNHKQLAESFVGALNLNGEYSVKLAKTFAKQDGYIVILDGATLEYMAIDISGYTSGADPIEYLSGANVYTKLDYVPGYYSYSTSSSYDSFCECYVEEVYSTWHEETYRDRWTGISFEKIGETSKDIESYSALAEQVIVQSRSQALAEKFGLSNERSQDIVRLALAWEKAGGKDLTDADQDAFSEELLGFSITEAKSAIKSKLEGQSEALGDLIQRAAEANGTTPEHIQNIIDAYTQI